MRSVLNSLSTISLRWMVGIFCALLFLVILIGGSLDFDEKNMNLLGILLLEVPDLLVSLTVVVYASKDIDNKVSVVAAWLFTISTVLSFKSMLKSTSTQEYVELITGVLDFIGLILLSSNAKNRFKSVLILWIVGSAINLLALLVKDEAIQAIMAIFGLLIFLVCFILLMVAGDRKRFLEEWNGNNSDTDYVFDASSAPPSPHHHPGEEPKQVLEPTLTQVETSAAALTFEKKKEMLMKLKELLDADILTQEEFVAETKKILER